MLAEIIADSLNADTGDRLTTFVLPRFPKLLQAELRTHRSTSQSHYSSRAIPVEKAIKLVQSDPFVFRWTRNQKGMGGADDLPQPIKDALTNQSLQLRDKAIEHVRTMLEMGCAKQEANRYLEPWLHGPVIISGTQQAWSGFFVLRCAEGVQPDFKAIAHEMRDLYRTHQPRELKPGEWHIPWVDKFVEKSLKLEELLKVSAARSARVSYANFDGDFSPEKDFALCDRLIRDRHSTPQEHQAKAMRGIVRQFRNYRGFMHYRQHVEEGFSLC